MGFEAQPLLEVMFDETVFFTTHWLQRLDYAPTLNRLTVGRATLTLLWNKETLARQARDTIPSEVAG